MRTAALERARIAEEEERRDEEDRREILRLAARRRELIAAERSPLPAVPAPDLAAGGRVTFLNRVSLWLSIAGCDFFNP